MERSTEQQFLCYSIGSAHQLHKHSIRHNTPISLPVNNTAQILHLTVAKTCWMQAPSGMTKTQKHHISFIWPNIHSSLTSSFIKYHCKPGIYPQGPNFVISTTSIQETIIKILAQMCFSNYNKKREKLKDWASDLHKTKKLKHKLCKYIAEYHQKFREPNAWIPKRASAKIFPKICSRHQLCPEIHTLI